MNLASHGHGKPDPLLVEEMAYPGLAVFSLLKDLQQRDLGLDNNILVVNTHLLFNAGKGDLKLAMLILIMKTILKLSQVYNVSDIFLCGDFNLIPNSMLYQWLSAAGINLEADLREYSNQNMIGRLLDELDIEDLVKLGDQKFKSSSLFSNKKRKIDPRFLRALVQAEVRLPESDAGEEVLVTQTFAGIFAGDDHAQFLETLSKLLCFKSAYAEFNRKFYKRFKQSKEVNALNFYFDERQNNNDSFVTQFTHNFKNTVDYIWFSANGKYKIGRVLQTPSPKLLAKNGLSCPFDDFGSDHFSLVVDFCFKQ